VPSKKETRIRFIPRRRFGEGPPEMIDAPDADPELLRGELRNLRRVNARIGSLTLVRDAVLSLAAGLPPGRPIEVIDLATGSADHPVALVEAFRTVGREIAVTAVDRHPLMLEEARAVAGHLPQIRLEQGNILALPHPDRRFDIAICSFAMHHFSRADGVTILREMDRLSRVGFVVHDLSRSYPAAAAAWIYTHLMTTNIMTRRDGYRSVMNALTAAEVRDMAAEAGVAGITVWNAARFRLMAVRHR
jgi:ubiquinone/menaquinone biosynthesis C-methylase UbiE